MILMNVECFDLVFVLFWILQVIINWIVVLSNYTFHLDLLFIFSGFKVYAILWDKFRIVIYGIVLGVCLLVIGLMIFVSISLAGCIFIRQDTINLFGINRTRQLMFNEKCATKWGEENAKVEYKVPNAILHNHTFAIRANRVLKIILNSNLEITQKTSKNWTVAVTNDTTRQAYTYANGDIFVQGGYMYISDEELAIVLGHEIAHTLLSHYDERRAKNVLSDISQILSLPFRCASRSNCFSYTRRFHGHDRELETEADVVGAFMASRSCFDPRYAPVHWAKLNLFDTQTIGLPKNAAAEINTSTHPDHLSRESKLRELLPKLLKERDTSGCPTLNSSDPQHLFDEFREYLHNETKHLTAYEFQMAFLKFNKRNVTHV